MVKLPDCVLDGPSSWRPRIAKLPTGVVSAFCVWNVKRVTNKQACAGDARSLGRFAPLARPIFHSFSGSLLSYDCTTLGYWTPSPLRYTRLSELTTSSLSK